MGLASMLRDSERVEAQITQRAEARLRLAISEAVASEMRKVLTGEERQPDELTERELQVLQAVADGKLQKEIAGELHLQDKSIRNYVSSILGKLETGTSAGAVAEGFRRGILR